MAKKRANWVKRKAEFAASLSRQDVTPSRRARSCSSKNRYPTRAAAENAIFACAEHGTVGLSCYQCEFCNGWHLTSKDY